MGRGEMVPESRQRKAWEREEGEEAPSGLTQVTPVSLNTDSEGEGRRRRTRLHFLPKRSAGTTPEPTDVK